MGEMISTRVAYGQALEEFGSNENVYVFDADLKSCTMTKYFAEKYPERFYNVGIAEANMVDIGAGFAACGATALVHTFAIFASGRVYDQVRNNVAYPGLNVKVVGSHAGLTVGEDGATHQCVEDISLMRTIPGMTVIVPCDAHETREAARAILETAGPCYLRTGRGASGTAQAVWADAGADCHMCQKSHRAKKISETERGKDIVYKRKICSGCGFRQRFRQGCSGCRF